MTLCVWSLYRWGWTLYSYYGYYVIIIKRPLIGLRHHLWLICVGPGRAERKETIEWFGSNILRNGSREERVLIVINRRRKCSECVRVRVSGVTNRLVDTGDLSHMELRKGHEDLFRQLRNVIVAAVIIYTPCLQYFSQHALCWRASVLAAISGCRSLIAYRDNLFTSLLEFLEHRKDRWFDDVINACDDIITMCVVSI